MGALLKRISDAMALVACLGLVALMGVTFIDVVGRYVFNAPLVFAVEVIELGMGVVVCFGLAATTLAKGHISVDLVSSVSPPAIRSLLARLAAVCGAAFFSLVAWRLWDRTGSFYDDGLATQVLYLPIWPVVALMTVAAAVSAVVAIWLVLSPEDAKPEAQGALD